MKILLIILSLIFVSGVSYWAYLYISDEPKVINVDYGVVEKLKKGKVISVLLENGEAIEIETTEKEIGSTVIITTIKGRRTGIINYLVSKPGKIMVGVNAKDLDQNGNFK